MARRGPFICDHPDCGKEYDRPAKLTEHKLSHSNERPHVCDECDSKFFRSSHLQRHKQLVHSSDGSKPFPCAYDGCEKSFALGHQLKRHLLVHGKEPKVKAPKVKASSVKIPRTFVCGECDFQTENKRELTNHQKAEHSPSKAKAGPLAVHECEECQKVYSKKSALTTHINTVHLDLRPFECPVCQSSFGYKAILQRHMRSMHDVQKEDEPSEEDIAQEAEGVPLAVSLSGMAYEAQRPFSCQGCRRRFVRQYDLERHMTCAGHQT